MYFNVKKKKKNFSIQLIFTVSWLKFVPFYKKKQKTKKPEWNLFNLS